ncbi:MAG: TatD family hydrolase [Synergistaceae bacterium]|nr:TatD family hydrolase [Synergistaceae bacterium]
MEKKKRDMPPRKAALLFVDTHCHVHPGSYGTETENVLRRAEEAGVVRMLVIGGREAENVMAAELAGEHSGGGGFAAVGIHPHEASCLFAPSGKGERIMEQISSLACRERVVAIGETGLDYHYDNSPREQQQQGLRMHLRLAAELKKPVVLHCREACASLLAILREEGSLPAGGVVHCFSGTREDAAEFLEMGYYLSFAGPLTFKKNDELRQIFNELPEDRILLETDSPYLAPHPFRGKRNEPAYIPFVYEKAAEVRGVSLNAMALLIRRNAQKLFHWQDQRAQESVPGE